MANRVVISTLVNYTATADKLRCTKTQGSILVVRGLREIAEFYFRLEISQGGF